MQVHKGHKWIAPPAGQGGQFEKVCASCGGRRSVMGDGECSGTGREVTLETKHDYDPYAD